MFIWNKIYIVYSSAFMLKKTLLHLEAKGMFIYALLTLKKYILILSGIYFALRS